MVVALVMRAARRTKGQQLFHLGEGTGVLELGEDALLLGGRQHTRLGQEREHAQLLHPLQDLDRRLLRTRTRVSAWTEARSGAQVQGQGLSRLAHRVVPLVVVLTIRVVVEDLACAAHHGARRTRDDWPADNRRVEGKTARQEGKHFVQEISKRCDGYTFGIETTGNDVSRGK